MGAAGGCVPAPAGYAKRVREICDKYGVIMISDEVMCGAGRAGTWRALEADGVEPDIMSVAKGLAAGDLPLGGRGLQRQGGGCDPWQAWRAHDRSHLHRPHRLLRGGRCVQKIVEREKLVERVHAMEVTLRAMLVEAHDGHRGGGRHPRPRLFPKAIELVADRGTKSPSTARSKRSMKIRQQGFDNGLICFPVGGNVDGINGDVVIIAPAYNATRGRARPRSWRRGGLYPAGAWLTL